MDARSYEKMYGLRLLFMLLAVFILGFCLFFMFSTPLLRGLRPNEVETPSHSPVLATPTDLQMPTLTLAPTNIALPLPTAQPSFTPTPEPVVTPTDSIVPTVTPVPSTSGQMVVCTGVENGYLNFRILPDNSVIGRLPEGKQVTFIKKADTVLTWYMIEVDGTQGYAYGSYLCNP